MPEPRVAKPLYVNESTLLIGLIRSVVILDGGDYQVSVKDISTRTRLSFIINDSNWDGSKWIVSLEEYENKLINL